MLKSIVRENGVQHKEMNKSSHKGENQPERELQTAGLPGCNSQAHNQDAPCNVNQRQGVINQSIAPYQQVVEVLLKI